MDDFQTVLSLVNLNGTVFNVVEKFIDTNMAIIQYKIAFNAETVFFDEIKVVDCTLNYERVITQLLTQVSHDFLAY